MLVDYKTTALKKLNTAYLVSAGNKAQIRAYVTLLKQMGKPMLPLAALIYLPRDKPTDFRVEMLRVNYANVTKQIESYREQFVLASSITKRSQLKELVEARPCSEGCLKQFEWCDWRKHCAGPENTKTVLRELNNVFDRVEDKLPIKLEKRK